MRAVDIITRKRDGEELSQGELEWFVREYVAGNIPDYQAAAWCMAVYCRGMTAQETTHLTAAMAYSGASLDLHDVAPFTMDKHSSGGVGDKTTLVVAPVVASLGVPVAKMSGRGLSFSGGTLDKLESISGFDANLTLEKFKKQLGEIGIVVTGQTHDLAPADGKLYALRDVTGTVPSLALIASSIMSKKIAAGADAIVLDVKVGHGAFMTTIPEAVELAELMLRIGRNLGRRMSALIGDMSQPLGLAIGNALEVVEAIETLKGGGPPDFCQHCLDVAAEMLLLAQVKATQGDARLLASSALNDGSAWLKFRQFISAQGGDLAQVDEPSRLPVAPFVKPLLSPEAGFLTSLDAREIGFAVVDLGGGRTRKSDSVDPAVGVKIAPNAKLGSKVEVGQPLLWVHARSTETLDLALLRLRKAYGFSPDPIAAPPLVHRVIREAQPNALPGPQ
jgi:pyrimidine-nucleoside phosphorylase